VARNPLRNVFAFLFTRRKKDELIAEYVIREHHRGRSLAEILKDPHIVNNYSPEDLAHLLDEPALIHAVGEDVIAAQRSGR
jgi:hypothetical protein